MGKWYHPVSEAKADKYLISHVINLRLPCMITPICSLLSSCQMYHSIAHVATRYSQIAGAIAELQNLGPKLFSLEYVLDIVLLHSKDQRGK